MTEWEKVELCELYDGSYYVVVTNDGNVDVLRCSKGTLRGATHVLVDAIGDPIEVPSAKEAE